MKIQYFLFYFFNEKSFFLHTIIYFFVQKHNKKKKKKFQFFYFCPVCGYNCLKTGQLRKCQKKQKKRFFWKMWKGHFVENFMLYKIGIKIKKQEKTEQQKKKKKKNNICKHRFDWFHRVFDIFFRVFSVKVHVPFNVHNALFLFFFVDVFYFLFFKHLCFDNTNDWLHRFVFCVSRT